MHQVNTKASGISALAQTTAVPNLHRPVRVPTYPALERTATLAFTDTTTYPVPAGGTASAVLLRDPAFPLWTEIAFPNVATSLFAEYSNISAPTIGTSTTTFPLADNPKSYGFTGTSPPAVTPMVSVGSQLYWCLGGRTRGTAGIAYQPTLELVCSSPAALQLVVTWELLTFDGEVVTMETAHVRGPATSGQGVVLPLTSADYFGFRVLTVGASAPSGTTTLPVLNIIRVGVTTTPPGASDAVVTNPIANPSVRGSVAYRMYPLQRSPEEAQNIIWENVRANATAVLFSNVTSVMNKEGTVQAARVPRRTFGPFDVTGWAFANVHPRDRYFGSLEKGFYAYTLSDAATELFRDCQGVPSYSTPALLGVLSANVFDYGSVEYATIIQFVDYDSTTSTTLAVTLDRHIEFRTTSRLFPTDYSRLRLEEYHAAQMALADMGTMFENPIHLSTIAKMALSAAKIAWPVVRPYVISAATGLASKALSRVDKIAGNMSQAGLVPPVRAPMVKKKTKVGKKNRQPKRK